MGYDVVVVVECGGWYFVVDYFVEVGEVGCDVVVCLCVVECDVEFVYYFVED